MNPIATSLQNVYYTYEISTKMPQELKELIEIFNDVYVLENNKGLIGLSELNGMPIHLCI